ncbi:hypothetical protein AAMO2058_001719700 [Amorphochlora amoebiformis]
MEHSWIPFTRRSKNPHSQRVKERERENKEKGGRDRRDTNKGHLVLSTRETLSILFSILGERRKKGNRKKHEIPKEEREKRDKERKRERKREREERERKREEREREREGEREIGERKREERERKRERRAREREKREREQSRMGPATAQDMIGFVKGYVMLVPSKENPKDARSVEHKITSVDQLESYRRICNTEYICRVYVYRASNLSPRTHLTSHTCNPYILVTNGDEADNQFNNEKNCSKNEVNPFFYQIIELRTLFPENSSLSIQIWDNDPMGANSMIGSTKIDLEQRLISGIPHGRKEYRKLLNPAYSTSQGLIQCKVDILTAEEARITKADELSPPQFQDYQLRLILWSTYGVKFPQLENRGLDVDQKIIVTSNFSGEKGEDIIKHTDVAWYAAEGCADWNYRMIFDVKLPCKNPRITISVWDEKVLGSNEAIGEVVLNLQTFFARCLLEKSARTRDKRKIVHFEHSNYRGVNLGSIKLEMTMYTKTEADENPAGEAQNEPNIDPYLPNPKRNAPPWAVGTRALDFLAGRRKLVLCLCIVIILLALFFPILYIAITASSVS